MDGIVKGFNAPRRKCGAAFVIDGGLVMTSLRNRSRFDGGPVFEDELDWFDDHPVNNMKGSTPNQALPRPVPGLFHKIQYGKGGLLETTARAYGVPLRPNPITLAQLINDHPYNQRFWRPPKNPWEMTHFPHGIINFNPHFACDVQAQQATLPGQHAPRGGCLATIWIPPAEQLVHPLLGSSTPVPWGALGLRDGNMVASPTGKSSPFHPQLRDELLQHDRCPPKRPTIEVTPA
jgi:hypothetical protein